MQGPTINLSKRYWAFAAFGRYIRPGAVRLAAQSGNGSVEVSAFRNRDGSIVVEALNTDSSAQPAGLQVAGHSVGGAAAYLTDAAHSVSPESPAAAAQLPPRSLTTFVIRGR